MNKFKREGEGDKDKDKEDEEKKEEEENEEDTKLDNQWIVDFEKTNNLYNDFYKDNIYYINIFFIYINKNNEIEKLKTEQFLLSELNVLSKIELMQILKNNIIDNQIKYNLLSILKYNITLENQDIDRFLNTNEHDIFLTPINNIGNIYFNKTINTFQDLNDLIILLNENDDENTHVHENKLKTNKHKLNITRKHILESLSLCSFNKNANINLNINTQTNKNKNKNTKKKREK
jgi:hypothetical protein